MCLSSPDLVVLMSCYEWLDYICSVFPSRYIDARAVFYVQ